MREMFAGEYACKLDEKGRFSVPMPLRQPFGLSEGSGTRGGRCWSNHSENDAFGCFPCRTGALLLELQQQRLSERESRLFMHHVVYDVVEVEMDRANRFPGTPPAAGTHRRR